MPNPISLTSTQVPTPTVASTFVKSSVGTPIGAKAVVQGETTTVISKLNGNACMIDNAYRYGSGGIGIGQGLELSAGTGLTLIVSPGHAIVGTLVEVSSLISIALPASQSRIHLWINSAGAIQYTLATLNPPDGTVCYLGSCSTDATSISSLDDSGRCVWQGGVLVRRVADAGAPSDQPSSACRLFTQTLAGTFWWDGAQYHQLLPAALVRASGIDKIGWFGANPVVKQAVADPAALSAPTTMGGAYVQAEAQALRNDIAAIRSSLAAVIDALQAYGLH